MMQVSTRPALFAGVLLLLAADSSVGALRISDRAQQHQAFHPNIKKKFALMKQQFQKLNLADFKKHWEDIVKDAPGLKLLKQNSALSSLPGKVGEAVEAITSAKTVDDLEPAVRA